MTIVKFTRTKKQESANSCTITFADLTQGQAIALMNALSLRATQSAVCRDVFDAAMEGAQSWPTMVEQVAKLDSWA